MSMKRKLSDGMDTIVSTVLSCSFIIAVLAGTAWLVHAVIRNWNG
jgi:hypothetical protein